MANYKLFVAFGVAALAFWAIMLTSPPKSGAVPPNGLELQALAGKATPQMDRTPCELTLLCP